MILYESWELNETFIENVFAYCKFSIGIVFLHKTKYICILKFLDIKLSAIFLIIYEVFWVWNHTVRVKSISVTYEHTY